MNRRCLWACLAALLGPAAAASLPAALSTPAPASLRAAQGLFVAVTRAGPRLVAVGEQGRILLSDDNGASWRQAASPTSATLTAVSFATPQLGWAAGQMGVILRTRDGGAHWQIVFDGGQANDLLQDAAATAARAQPDNQAAEANLAAAKQFVAGGVTVPFLGLRALSADDIIATGGFGMAFESQDGGAYWAPLFDAIPNPNGLNIYAVLPAAGGQYFLGEQGFLVRRTGSAFTALTTPAAGTFFGGLAAPDGSLVLYGLQGSVVTSADGAHWTSIPTGVTAGINAGLVLADGRLVLGDGEGDILLSTDNGRSFTQAAQVQEPIAGLAQAANGDLIAAGPQGLRDLTLARLHGV